MGNVGQALPLCGTPCHAGLAVTIFALVGFQPALKAQPPAQPGIEGDIDGPKALHWLYGNYDAAKKQSRSKEGLSVKVYATQDGVVDGKQEWFLYTIELNENYCKQDSGIECRVTLAAAMFEKQDQFWVLKADDRNLGHIEDDFHPPGYTTPADKAVKWGTQAYGLLVNHRGFNFGDFSGETRTEQALYGFENGAFRQIFNLWLSYQDVSGPPGPTSRWEAEWSFGPSGPTGIYDIAIKMKKVLKLTKEDKLDPTAHLTSYRRGSPVPGVYRYDGKMYRHTRTQAELTVLPQ